MLVPLKIRVLFNILKYPLPYKTVLRNHHVLPISACDALWGILHAVACSWKLCPGKTLFIAPSGGAGAGSGGNTVPTLLHSSQILEAS